MAFEGMDPEVIRSIAGKLNTHGGQLQHVMSGCQSALSSAQNAWKGPDSQKFQSEWSSSYKPAIQRAHDDLASMATLLQRQVQDQTTASSGSGAGGGIGGGLGGTVGPIQGGPAVPPWVGTGAAVGTPGGVGGGSVPVDGTGVGVGGGVNVDGAGVGGSVSVGTGGVGVGGSVDIPVPGVGDVGIGGSVNIPNPIDVIEGL